MRFIVFILTLFCVFAIAFSISLAQPAPDPADNPGVNVIKDPAEAFVVDWRNLQGDTLYLLKADTLAVGIGTTIATFYDVVELRVEYAYAFQRAEDTKSLVGIGLGVNVASLIEALHGEWKLPELMPSVGFIALADFADKPKLEIALYLTVFRQSF